MLAVICGKGDRSSVHVNFMVENKGDAEGSFSYTGFEKGS